MFKVLASLIVIASTSALAQNINSDLMLKKPRSLNVSLDGTSLILSGLGAKATYSLTNKLLIGGLIKSYQIKEQESDKAIGYEYSHKVNVIGAVVDFFPGSSNQENGIYFSAAFTSANVLTNVDDSYFGSSESKDSAVGGQVMSGYQFLVPIRGIIPGKDSFALMFHAGLGYGNAGKVKWSITGKNTELQDSLLLDLYAGAQF